MDEEVTARLLKNYYNARKSWEGWCFLNNLGLKKGNPNIRNITDKNEFLSHCRYLLLKDTHIELYKIISDNDKNSHDNIFKLLKKSSDERAVGLIEELSGLKKELKSVTNARNKVYAHLDKEYRDFLVTFKIDEFHKIFCSIESAIIVLGKEKELKSLLNEIPSRDDFTLEFVNYGNE